jgi:hypothetical protein
LTAPRSTRVWFFLSTCIAAASLGVGCGQTARHTDSTPRRAQAGAQSGSPEQNLLDSLAAKLGTTLASAKVTAPPSDAADTAPLSWLTATLPSTASFGDEVRPKWEAMLLVGAYDAEAGSAGVGQLSGFSVIDPSHRTADGASAVLSARTSIVDITPTTATTAAIADAERSNLEQLGLRVNVVSVLDADGPAVIADVTVSDPNAFLARAYTQAELFGSDQYSGTLLIVRDESGAIEVATAHSDRISGGTTWVAPGLNDAGTSLQDN